MSNVPAFRPPPPSPALIGIVSDDLTGANGVAAMFAARGVPARTLLGVPERRALIGRSGVIVVDTDSRDAAPGDAYRTVRATVRALRRAGAGPIAKRLDTTLRGNIGAEIAAVLDALPRGAVALVVPAAPEAGRTAVGGRVLLDGRPLSAVTGGRDDPLALVVEQSGLRAAPVPLDVVRRGPAAVAEAVARAAVAGTPVLVFDAETLEDVRIIAHAAAASEVATVPVDPGGFTLAWAVACGLLSGPVAAAPADGAAEQRSPRRGAGPRLARPTETGAARILAVFGSHSAIAAEQVRTAAAGGSVSLVALDLSACGDAEATRAEVARTVDLLRQNPARVVGIRAEDRRAAPASSPAEAAGGNAVAGATCYSARAATRLRDAGERRHSTVAPDIVASALAGVAAGLLARDRAFRGLYLSGGAVARATLEALGAGAVDVDGEVLPLAASGRLVGGPHAGLRVVTKGGMIGGADAVAVCLRHLAVAVGMPGDET